MKLISTITEIFTQVDSTALTMVQSVYDAMAITFKPFVQKLLIISTSIFGFSLMFGWIDYPVRDFLKKLLLWTAVYALVFNWSIFFEFIYTFFFEGFDQLSVKLFEATNGGNPPPGGGISGILDSLLRLGIDATSAMFSAGGYTNLLPFILGVLVFIAMLLVVIYTGYLFILGKIAIALLLSLAPVFIIFLLFEMTKQMFSAWLKQLFSYGFIIVFATLAILFFNTLLTKALSIVINAAVIGAGVAAPIIIVSIISILVLSQTTQMAAAVSSGMQLASVGAFGATSAAYRGAKNAGGKIGSGVRKGASATFSKIRKSSNSIKRK